MLKKIIVTGGEGRFARELKKIKSKYNFIFRNKKQLNVLSLSSIKKILIILNHIVSFILQDYQDQCQFMKIILIEVLT